MTKLAKGKHVFRRANDSANDWREMTADEAISLELQGLRESKKMKEKGWKSRYFWELPYGEGSDFCEWLQSTFNSTRRSFQVKGFDYITIYTHYTHNEVGEPFLDCEAYLPKSVLVDVCDLIMREWNSLNQ